jgi:UTP--glucose-1-phosphate uridylyltransferase
MSLETVFPEIKQGNNHNRRIVKDVVIAAAGYGTRLLPFTTFVSKELLPIGGIPIVQLLIDECLDAGIENIYVMTRSNSTVIRDHFNGNVDYASFLKTNGRTEYLRFVEGDNKYRNINFIPVDMNIPYGNAQGILTIQSRLECLPNFLLLWGDDIVLGEGSSIKEIIQKYQDNECDAVIGVQKKDALAMSSYGNVQLDATSPDRVRNIITKPKTLAEVVSEYAVFGQMILPGNIFQYLDLSTIEGEPDVTAIALQKLSKVGTVLKAEVSGKWVTIGDPENYFKALLTWFLLNKGDKSIIFKIIEELENVRK